jgi:chromosome segregation ATPase
LAQIDDLKKKLESASRVDSKRIQQQINELTNEKSKLLREM